MRTFVLLFVCEEEEEEVLLLLLLLLLLEYQDKIVASWLQAQ